MKVLLAIRPKYKVAWSLLMLIIILLCGVLAERSFFSRVNEASTSIYNDRLVPSTAVYHLSDHITQRRFLAEAYVQKTSVTSADVQQQLSFHQQQMDSIITAFEETYLVKNESKSLKMLKAHLQHYSELEKDLLVAGGMQKFKAVHTTYDKIREELMELSEIQTRVGQKLLDETHSITSNAGVVSQLQVAVLIIICFVLQAFILATKAISPPIQQRHNLN